MIVMKTKLARTAAVIIIIKGEGGATAEYCVLLQQQI